MRTEQKQKFDWDIVGVGIVLAIVVGGFAIGMAVIMIVLLVDIDYQFRQIAKRMKADSK